jgi:tetratricopeptide (TPR) repeat protein
MSDNRSIRVFVSSTFRDMVEERDELMTQTWPELRRRCRELQVELVEVDLRWGIAEEQSTRKETLKLCLDEIRACRPFFIGLLGERYGWAPGTDAFTADLQEEQPWLRGLDGKSVTELEILHGVLNNPEMAGRSFFYFRDPAYALARGADFLAEDADAAHNQAALKAIIRRASADKHIPLREKYPDPRTLAALVLQDLKEAIEAQFPIEDIPDPLTREARDHEAFAEIRRRTYIGRPDYFARLDRHAAGNSGPLVLVGDSGSGKSALVANWIQHWRAQHPNDFLFQHYIGGTSDSADHWRLIARLITEIKRWTNDPENVPSSHDDLLHDFPLWLAKARSKAERDGVRCILVLDALNQLEDHDHARLLGWLPAHPFTGGLRLMVSTLPGDTMEAVAQRGWESLRIEPLTPDERRRMVEHYLARFAKKLDPRRLDRLVAAPAAANPLYLKILLDELRVTGTHDRLDERLNEYLSSPEIPALLQQVLARYQRDYERDRPGLVSESLGLIWAARRGLAEFELLRLLKPANLPQLPLATWSPLRAALEEGLVDRGGILNFAHDFLRSAVEAAFVPNEDRRDELRLQLADEFEQQPISTRSCDELPWLFQQTKQNDRLRACLLDVDRFLEVFKRDQEELARYWVFLGEEGTMGSPYLVSFEEWSKQPALEDQRVSIAANNLAHFLDAAALFTWAEPLMRRALAIDVQSLGPDHPDVATQLNNLARLLKATNQLDEAEALYLRALAIQENSLGTEHPNFAGILSNVAELLYARNRLDEAEPLMRRLLEISERSYGPDHSNVATQLTNLATLLQDTNRLAEAEPLMRRALAIDEQSYGPDHPDVAICINHLAQLLYATNRLAEAEPLICRALEIDERSFGINHPRVAARLNNLATLLQATNRPEEAEQLMRRARNIDERSYGLDHPEVARDLSNLAQLLKATNRLGEAEPLTRHALAIYEQSFGPDHPNVATVLNNLAELLQITEQLAEAEPLYRRALAIIERSYGPDHPSAAKSLNNLAQLLQTTDRLAEAEQLVHRALAINERSYGQDHPEVATDLNSLAGLLCATSRLAEAEPLYRRAMAIDERSCGPDHPKVAIGLNNLAQLLKAMNRLAEAEPLMRRALVIDERSFGPDDPNVARGLNNLAQLLKTTNRLTEAEPMMRRALAIWEKSLGSNRTNVASALINLAALLQATNRPVEAEPLMRRALEIEEQSFGPDHPDVATALMNLGSLLHTTNRLAEAEPLMRRAVEIRLNFTRVTGNPHPHLAGAVNYYAGLLGELGRNQEQILATLREMAPEFFR